MSIMTEPTTAREFTCPPWCSKDHDSQERWEGHHVTVLGRCAGITVEIWAFDADEDAPAMGPFISVNRDPGQGDEISPASALKLAEALKAAAGQLSAMKRGESL